MLALDGVGVRVGETSLLHGVSLSVAPGGLLGVIGPNGAGKSTLVRAIVGLVAHDGTIRVADRTAHQLGTRGWARLVAYVPQRPVLPPAMTVADYALLGRAAHHALLGAETTRDRSVVGAVLERLALDRFRSRPLSELSGGEVQRVVLARALAQEAPLLVMDEPTTGLDLGHSQLVLALTDELRRERALCVLCTLHDLTLAGQHADELVVLHRGGVAVAGRPDAVLTEANVARYFGATVEILAGSGGIVVAPAARPVPPALSVATAISEGRPR